MSDGNSILGNNLVDRLIPTVVDSVRESLHPLLGVRQFRMFLVELAYPERVGVGTPTITECEVRPQPLILEPSLGSAADQLEDCGVDEVGLHIATEVSLQFTEAQLGYNPPGNINVAIRLDDGQGQQISRRYFRHQRRPYPDRLKDMGWKLWLIPTSAPAGL